MDTDVRWDSGVSDALRSEMPRFGIPTSTPFNVQGNTFSLVLEDGLWGIPAVPITNSRQQKLQKVVISFVYSEGAIHTLTSQAEYGKEETSSDTFSVEYQWIREEDVRLKGGQFVLLLLVFGSSIVFLFLTCGFDEPEATSREKGGGGERVYVQKKW